MTSDQFKHNLTFCKIDEGDELGVESPHRKKFNR